MLSMCVLHIEHVSCVITNCGQHQGAIPSLSIALESVVFLNCTVIKDNDKLHTNLRVKDPATHSYVRAESCHLRHIIQKGPCSQFLICRCYKDANFEHHAAKMKHHYENRGYDKDTIEQAKTELQKNIFHCPTPDDQTVWIIKTVNHASLTIIRVSPMWWKYSRNTGIS